MCIRDRVYCTRGGLAWLGAMDSFISDPWGGIALLGLLEAAVVGWAYRVKRLREHANERSDWKLGLWWDLTIRYVAPLLLSGLFAWSVLERASAPGGLLYNEHGVFQTPALVGLIVAIAAPILALVLSCMRSPGADTHAQHVGQPRVGRKRGIVGLVLVGAGLALVAGSFYLGMQARWISSEAKAAVDVVGFALVGVQALCLAVAAAVAAIAGTILGTSAVYHGENTNHRPSGLARLSAGLGVIIVGGATGLFVFIRVLLSKFRLAQEAASQAATSQAAGAGELDHLTGASYAVLAGMLALLVTGLGWCFYRAIKASGATAGEQVSEGTE